MSYLTAEVIRPVPSPDGPQAQVRITEPNGDTYEFLCLCRDKFKTELGEPSENQALAYVVDKYGQQVIFALCRFVTLQS